MPILKEDKEIIIQCGQIWKLNSRENKYNVGLEGEYFIVLSRDNNVWLIGCFWGMDNNFGGARQKELTENEIKEIGEYVANLKDLICLYQGQAEKTI